jgi:hypothetical protein
VSPSGRHVVAGLAAFGQEHDRLKHIPIPEAVSAEHLGVARRDAEIIAASLASNPAGMGDLLQAALDGEFDQAQQLLQELGLTESQIQIEGGGLFWLVVVVVIIIILYPGTAE